MAVTRDPSLASAIDALALRGVLIGHRLIMPGDEDSLLPQEAHAFASSVVKVRRASGAARIVARQLLAQLGHEHCAVPKAPSGAPIWPAGVVGSLTHDSRVAVAAVGRRRDVAALGIDVEPAESLPPDLLDSGRDCAGAVENFRRPLSRATALRRQGGRLQGRLPPRPDIPRSSRRPNQSCRAQSHRSQWPNCRIAVRYLHPFGGAGIPARPAVTTDSQYLARPAEHLAIVAVPPPAFRTATLRVAALQIRSTATPG